MGQRGGEKLTSIKTIVISGQTRQIRGEHLIPIVFKINIELPSKHARRMRRRPSRADFNDRPVGYGRNAGRGAGQWNLNASFNYTMTFGRPAASSGGGGGRRRRS